MFHVSPRAVMTSRSVPKDSGVDPDLLQWRWHRFIFMAPAICVLSSLSDLGRRGTSRASDRQTLHPEVLALRS